MTVEKIDVAYEWKGFLQVLERFNLSGHVQSHAMTKANLEACHCYQLTSRATFEKMFPGAEVENLPSYPAMPKDIILQVWQYMASPTQAQKPLMFIPESGFQGIGDGESIQAAGRRHLFQKQCNEFLKTSRVVGTTPWNLRGACQYLRDFVQTLLFFRFLFFF